ncbi:LOW QUALITY PROTEIN: multidrug resistance protein homolog 49 [Aphomia sociella]
MKGQSKRFVNHKGNAYKMGAEKKNVDDANVGFFSLWRYADTAERAATLAGVALGWCASFGLIAAVVIYGEITSLFVQRHRAAATTPHAHILSLFGGGTQLPAGNRTLHMNALMDDSIAFGLASVVIIIIQFLSAALAVTVANWAAARMVARVRRRLLRAVLSQEVAYFDTNTTMNFASTLTEDTEKIRAGVGEHVVMTSYLGGSVVLATVLSLTYGWQLTLAGVSVVPIAIILSSIVAKYQTRCTTKEVVAYGTAGRIVEEVLSAIRTVRAYAGEEIEVQRFQAALGAGGAWARRRAAWAGAGAGAGWLLTYALNAIVFAYGAALCVRDMELPPHQQHYHPGVMLTILFCTFMASQNIVMCQPHLEIFSAARGAAKSLFKIMERKSNIDAMQDKGTKPDKFSGEIVFDNLYFNYPSRPDVKVLRGLTLKVKPGETVALVGSSGCGKSTLLHLLQRMYEPDSGSISVDGHKLEDLNLHHFRTSIGVVGQEPVLFSGTIRENITLGMPDATEEEVIAAAKTANAHHFITKLANGYSTEIGARGASLSGGQKQRVAIARALLRRPALLLLDEPTSALDPTSERQVQAALDAASKGRTTLVVSHRLSTIENASRIVYVEQGAVLEQGSHDELLEKRGAYWRLLQDDLSTRNIASTLSESTADDDQVEDGLGDGSPPARGARVGRTGSAASRQSLHRESFARSSIRLGAVSAAHIQPALDLTPYEEEDELCQDDEEPPACRWSLMKLNAPEWPLLLGGGVASVLVGASMPVFALLLSRLYGMFASSDADLILSQSRLYAGLFALVAAVCGLVMFLQTWLFNKAGIALTDRLRVMSFRNFLYQEQGWFDSAQNSVGALCARLASDCAAVQGATGTRLGTVLQGVSTMCIGVTLAMAYSWKMTLVSLLSVPCVIGGIYLEGYITKQSQERERKALELASRAATEAVLNVRTVQSLGVEETLIGRYASALRGAGGAGKSAALRGAVYGLCLCAPTLGYAVALAYGGALIANDELHYEYAILVAEALIYGAWMLAEALSFAPNFAAARRSGARILVALRRQTNIRDEPTATHDPDWIANGSLEFDNVHFRYPTRPGVAVLRGLTLKLQAGHTLALVGGSGCGKSTLMHLLMRNYDADSGSVKLDGRDVKTDLTLKSLRAQLGLVQQEPVVFERTIMENIAYGDNSREVGIDEVIEAAKQANIHTFIAGLPMGYGTRLEAGGGALSGGQKQRVARRALLRRPRLLLLDEATSALDAAGERSVQAALEAAARGRSTVIIAHRLATVRHAHTIALIDKGVVAESGTHDELVRKRGLYWELLQQQSPHEAIA